MILNRLSSRDIASLRLATPSFRSVPNTVFKRLVLEELPWFWEANSLPDGITNWYALYSKVKHVWCTSKGLRNRKRVWKDVEEIVKRIERAKEQSVASN